MRQLALLALVSCWTAPVALPGDPAPIHPRATHPRIADLSPPGLGNIWLGMPHDSFSAARPRALRTNDEDGRRITYVESTPAIGIADVDYFLTRDGDEPLYEVRATYSDPDAAKRILARVYGPHGKLDPWSLDDNQRADRLVIRGYPFVIEVWTDNATLILIAAMPGSEWAHEDFDQP